MANKNNKAMKENVDWPFWSIVVIFTFIEFVVAVVQFWRGLDLDAIVMILGIAPDKVKLMDIHFRYGINKWWACQKY